MKNNSNIIHFFRSIYIFARYPKYFIAILLFSSPSMFSCFASTHIYLDTYEHFRAIVFLPLRLRTFAGEIRPRDPVLLFHLASSSILFLFLQSPHPSFPSSLLFIFMSSLTAILPFCHHLSAFVPFSLLFSVF